jgi:Poly(R)-hydroxyalkanoic acid synthase subunit (PHA_synth_III_E)
MADDRPLWRQAFDAWEQAVAPRLEEYVRTDEFADAASSFSRAQADFQRRTEKAMQEMWHFWNIPAGSDVQRLSDQVASLERRVRDLTKLLEDREADEQKAAKGD